MDMQPGMILSRDEARAAKDTVSNAYKAGYLDVLTTIQMQWDITCRTVPTA